MSRTRAGGSSVPDAVAWFPHISRLRAQEGLSQVHEFLDVADAGIEELALVGVEVDFDDLLARVAD